MYQALCESDLQVRCDQRIEIEKNYESMSRGNNQILCCRLLLEISQLECFICCGVNVNGMEEIVYWDSKYGCWDVEVRRKDELAECFLRRVYGIMRKKRVY